MRITVNHAVWLINNRFQVVCRSQCCDRCGYLDLFGFVVLVERERQTDRQTETERHSERHTERERLTERETERDIQRQRETDRQRQERQTDRQRVH